MATWIVGLTGRDVDLQALADHLGLPECSVREEKNNKYYLASSSFDALGDSASVVQRGQELIQRLNGVGRLLNLIAEPVSFGDEVMQTNGDGKRAVYFLPPAATARGDGAIPRISGIAPPESSTAETFMLEAEGDPAVARAIRLFGNSHTWDSLYKVLDAIKEAVGGDKKLKNWQWVADSGLNRFTQTANSFLAVGDAARHGNTKTPAPPNPMSLSEATELIQALVTTLMQSRTVAPQ